MLLELFYKFISLVSLISGSFMTGTTFRRMIEDTDFDNFNRTIYFGCENLTATEGANNSLHILKTLEEYWQKDLNVNTYFEDKLDNQNITAILDEVKSMWGRYKSFLMTSEGVSSIVGVVQVIVAFVLILSSVKGRGANRSRHFSRVWIYHYFILGFILIPCIITHLYFSETNPLDIFDNVDSLIKCLKLLPSAAPIWFYVFVLTDACVLILLGFLTCCMSKRIQAK